MAVPIAYLQCNGLVDNFSSEISRTFLGDTMLTGNHQAGFLVASTCKGLERVTVGGFPVYQVVLMSAVFSS